MVRHGWYGVARRQFGIRLRGVVFALALCATAGPSLVAQTATAPTATEDAPTLIRPPETPKALEGLGQQVAAEMERLAPSTQPAASAPATQPAEAVAARETATALYNSLQQLAGKIEQITALRRQLEQLKSPEGIESFARELSAIQQRTQEFEARLADPPPFVTEEEVQRIQAEYEARLAEIRTRSAAREERIRLLASAPQRLQEAAARTQKALTDFQGELSRLTVQRNAAKTPVERRLAEQEIRRAQVNHSLSGFDEAILKLTQERDTILQNQSERRFPLVRTTLGKLADWKNKLQQIRSHGERQRIQAHLDFLARHPDSAPAHEQTYWEIKLLAIAGCEELDKKEQALRSRFVEYSELDPKQDIATEQASWQLLTESLDRRPSRDIREMYVEIRASIRSWKERLTRIRRLLDRTVDEQRDLTSLIDDYNAQLRARTAAFNKQLEAYVSRHPGDARAEKLSQDIVEANRNFTEQAQQFQSSVSRLIARLKEASGATESFVTQLEDYRSRLYWRYLYVPERFLWSYRLAQTKTEWLSAREQSEGAQVLQELRDTAAEMGPAEWTLCAVAIALAAGAGIWLRRRALAYAQAIMELVGKAKAPEGEPPVPISDRLHLFAARYAARTAPVVLSAAAVLVLISLLDVPALAGTLAAYAMAFVIGAAMSATLIQLLFVPGKPRLRLLRCSNVVAAHYRRWAMALWFATVILAAPPLVLTALDLAPHTRGFLFSLYEIVALLLVVIFGFRKQLVIRVAGRPEQIRHRGMFAIVSAVYPALWLGTVALLVAGLAGYGALVAYAVFGFAKTVVTITIALLVARYLTDLLLRYGRAYAARTEATYGIPTPPGPGTGGTPESGRIDLGSGGVQTTESPEAQPASASVTLQLAAAVIRWAVALGAVALILSYWGITTVEARSVLRFELLAANPATGRAAITVGSILAAIVSITVAWWVSRAVRSVLNTKVYPAYAGIDLGASAAINTILHYLLILVGLYFALVALRMPLGALTVLLGTMGLGIGLGLQPLFVNFISGLMILFERHVRVGDLIDVNGKIGQVTDISMRSTSIKTGDNIDLVIPNSNFITQSVVNWTFHETRIRGQVSVGVAYGADEQLVRRLLLEIARKSVLVLRYPPPEVWFTNFGENSLDFALLAWFRNPADRGRFLNEIRFEISRVFRENGVAIPFPHRTLTTSDDKPLPIRLVGLNEGTSGSPSPPTAPPSTGRPQDPPPK